MPFSVIVPAHDEEAVIGRCLRSLLATAEDGEIEVVVVANGCTDGTAAAAAAAAPEATVIEVAEGSKTGALNTGDAHANHFPRLYLDADVVVSTAAARAVADVLREDTDVLAAAPRIEMDLDAVPSPVAAYHTTWMALHNTPWMIGTGVYGLSRAGRERCGPFPDVIADDHWVRTRFAPGERVRVEPPFVVHPARTFRDLLARKARVFVGMRQLEARFPAEDLAVESNMSPREFVRAAPLRRLPHAIVYLAVTVAAKALAAWRIRRNDLRWGRDESSRRT